MSGSKSLVVDFKATKITTDPAGRVWVAAGYQQAQNTNVTAENWLAGVSFQKTTVVRVPGVPRNAELLLRLAAMASQQIFARLEVCSPGCCNSVAERDDPKVLLMLARKAANRAPSVGGWHEFDEADTFAYCLADRVNKDDFADVDVVNYELTNHPVWRHLSFIPHLDPLAAARLVGTVIDPRWYVDPADPDKTSKLPQYMGMDPKVQVEKRVPPSARRARFDLVKACWKTTEPPKLEELAPNQFLWRIWLEKGGGSEADLLASKVFISYLRATWTAAVCRTAHASHLFVPGYFFSKPAEAVAYEEYLGIR